MPDPVATYRIQFHKDFTFKHLENILPYLKQLGVTTIYASPVFKSTPGSTHGYDGVAPDQINPEIGNEEQLRKISEILSKAGMKWLQDIVPNHMAFHPENSWLMDVLEKGTASAYASYFDIDFNDPVNNGRLMVPFLGNTLESVIESGELQIIHEDSRFFLKYHDNYFPINEGSSKEILNYCKKGHGQLQTCIDRLNNDRSFLLKVAEAQYYRLCHWQETDRHINYRRFFTINGLICVNIHNEQVFESYHKLVKKLVDDKIFYGLRIDHIDGLYDPTAYLDKLRDYVGEDVYVVVEKILHHDEKLPAYWSAEGNSGYDFLALANNLLTNKKAEPELTSFYRQLVADTTTVGDQVREKKAHILYEHMAGELEHLSRLFTEVDVAEASSVAPEDLKAAIGQMLVECPVYRFYGNRFPLEAQEQQALMSVFSAIRGKNPGLNAAVDVLERVLLVLPETADEAFNDQLSHFYRRCHQFSGPLMAKGVEDTLMYTYHRFIGHNDVGDGPQTFGLSVPEFHERMIERQELWPLSINTTSTHDTKRGEDVRARLNVLTDLSDEWLRKVKEWRKLNASLKKDGAPDANDEYFIYQTLAGIYPMDDATENNFTKRLDAYLEKALREAKIHSDWTAPDLDYEHAAKSFTTSLLDRQRPFWTSFSAFIDKIIDAGIVNAVAQLILKFTCPGVPDVYQGTELWDLSLVDPDNRRPVDYRKREEILGQLEDAGKQPEEVVSGLWNERRDGRIKLWLTHRLLELRKQRATLFAEGLYIPLQTEGVCKDHVLAFARRYRHEWIVTVVPLNIALLASRQKTTVDAVDWKNTRVALPEDIPAEYTHLFTAVSGKAGRSFLVKELLGALPFAVLELKPKKNDRGAGILLAVSSLPAPFGIGDMGPAAVEFVDALSKSRQKYWQILPLNPTERGAGHSPYSSFSSMAGNPLLISPELLAAEGLLAQEDLKTHYLPVKDKADYDKAEKVKRHLFDTAYEKFTGDGFRSLKREFDRFLKNESYWLDDMALYVVLKQHFHNKPWHEWDAPYKDRSADDLEDFDRDHAAELTRVKWLQFIFLRQWKWLRRYANLKGVRLFGDMPFYVSYDSVDVWSRPDLFSLDDKGCMTGIAGVPPDYFSADGQLWGMPTFNWERLKEEKYDWWVRRLRKNLELFDLLRIDHFRAFQEYWEVPAGATTARNGRWLPGPRQHFFDLVKQELGKLPFVAEDLGDRMEAVYELRDRLHLPGMKVLQFAWGEHMPYSVDIPHNHTHNTIVYTGTHDNNTTIGWYKEETNSADHRRMHHYLGLSVRKKNIHEILARLAYASVARIAILPMQDVLGLDETARMNTPGIAKGNWLWRLKSGQFTEKTIAMLRDWAETFNRY